MYKKFLAGELSLGETFWKFGVLGCLICYFIVRVCGHVLAPQLHGRSIFVFLTHYYNPLRDGSDILLSVVCYLTSLVIFFVYLFSVILGVWRSSAEYDKSALLKYLARIVVLLALYFSLHLVF